MDGHGTGLECLQYLTSRRTCQQLLFALCQAKAFSFGPAKDSGSMWVLTQHGKVLFFMGQKDALSIGVCKREFIEILKSSHKIFHLVFLS